MRIIREGQLPEDKLFRGTCMHCKTVFECKRHEGKYSSTQRDGDLLEVDCPKCNHRAFAYEIKSAGGSLIPEYDRAKYTWNGDTSIGGDGGWGSSFPGLMDR